MEHPCRSRRAMLAIRSPFVGELRRRQGTAGSRRAWPFRYFNGQLPACFSLSKQLITKGFLLISSLYYWLSVYHAAPQNAGEKPLVIHYRASPEAVGCGRVGSCLNMTADVSQVSCKLCLRAIE